MRGWWLDGWVEGVEGLWLTDEGDGGGTVGGKEGRKVERR